MASALNPNPRSDARDMKSSTESQTTGLVASVPETWWTRMLNTSASSAKLARLKISFIGACRRRTPRPIAAPTTRDRTRAPGSPARTNTPITSGISLKENDCASLRKWMNTRHHSPAAKATTSAAIGTIIAADGRRRGATTTTYRRAAAIARPTVSTQMGATLRARRGRVLRAGPGIVRALPGGHQGS